MLQGGVPMAAPVMPGQAPAAAPSAPEPASSLPATFEDLIEAFWQKSKGHLAQEMHDCVGIIRYDPPMLEYRGTASLSPDFATRIIPALREVTGVAWTVTQGEGEAKPTLLANEQRQLADSRAAILETPVVKAAMDAAKAMGAFVDSLNENSNGNALARICEIFLTKNGRPEDEYGER
jgi:DNA polymerase-3 subunit gamma/tau